MTETTPPATSTTTITTTPQTSGPSDFIQAVVGKVVVVRLNSGVDYKGTLACLDGYMNLALENTAELISGVARNHYGDCFIRGNNDVFVAVITEVSRVGTVQEKTIFRIQTVHFVSLTTDKFDNLLSSGFAMNSNDPPDDVVRHPCQHLQKIFSTGSFYFSRDFDLTNSLQKRSTDAGAVGEVSMFEVADSHFWWNRHMLKDFLTIREKELSIEERAGLDRSGVFVLAMQGFVGIQDFRLDSTSAKMIIISRLSCKRAGTRYNSRGISDDGHVANFVETEFQLYTPLHTFSVLQIRGSVPLFWEQTGIQFGHKVEIARGYESTFPAVQKHFAELVERYGTVNVVDLLGQKETSNEYALTTEYKNHVQELKRRGVPVEYNSFDFHAMVKGNNFENLGRIVEEVGRDMRQYGCFVVENASGEKIALQSGIFRTQCLDCLDRTNVVQTLLAKQSLDLFLQANNPQLRRAFQDEQPQSLFSALWGDNGDWISRIYAGTGALKSQLTRSGKQTFMGFLDDAAKTVNRFVINNFQDKARQEAIDLILGMMSMPPGSSLIIQNPLHEAVAQEMQSRQKEYSVHDTLTVFLGTWNVNGKPAPANPDMILPFIETTTSITPDMYIFGLQEMVEMSAAAIVNADTLQLRQGWVEVLLQIVNSRGKGEYVMLRCMHLVGIALFVIVKVEHAPHIRNVMMGIKKTGMGGMAGNKGGVALSFNFHDTSLCFLTAHLAAGTPCEERNKDYATITNGLVFRGKRLEDHDVVFWLGDFNYRVALPNDEVRVKIRSGAWMDLIPYDQLQTQKQRGFIFHSYEEGSISFMPTYKYDNGTDVYDTSEKARTPSWTDRILYRGDVTLMEYTRSELRMSDHKPVRGIFRIKTLIVDKAAKERIEKEVYMEKMAQFSKSPGSANQTSAAPPPLPPRKLATSGSGLLDIISVASSTPPPTLPKPQGAFARTAVLIDLKDSKSTPAMSASNDDFQWWDQGQSAKEAPTWAGEWNDPWTVVKPTTQPPQDQTLLSQAQLQPQTQTKVNPFAEPPKLNAYSKDLMDVFK